MPTDADKERARRLREAQLAYRNPGDSKIKGYNWDKHNQKSKNIAVQRRKQEEKFILFAIWDTLPTRYKGAVYGLLFGIAAAIPLLFVLSAELRLLIIAPIMICAVVGMVIGKMMQENLS